MPSFFLVHGGAHGAWCWARLLPHLEASPDVDLALAVDLTGHGARIDAKPRDAIRLVDYVDDVTCFDAGHSAFASRPRALAQVLLRYARPRGAASGSGVSHPRRDAQ